MSEFWLLCVVAAVTNLVASFLHSLPGTAVAYYLKSEREDDVCLDEDMNSQGDDEVCCDFLELCFEVVEVNRIDLPYKVFQFGVFLANLFVLVVDDLQQFVVTLFSELWKDNLLFSFVMLLGIEKMHSNVCKLSDIRVYAGGELEVVNFVSDLIEVGDEAQNHFVFSEYSLEDVVCGQFSTQFCGGVRQDSIVLRPDSPELVRSQS